MTACTIKEFNDKHRVFDFNKNAGLRFGSSASMDEVWDKCDALLVVKIATSKGVLDDFNVRKFACWCARKWWHVLGDDRLKQSIKLSEMFADCELSEFDLACANKDAWFAIRELNESTNKEVRHAFASAAWASFHKPTQAAIHASTQSAMAGDFDCIIKSQAEYLRKTFIPDFSIR